MLRKFLAGAAALATGLVAACDQAPQSTVTYMRPGGVWDFASYATGRGPLLVQALNTPLGYGDAHAVERIVAQAMEDGLRGLNATVTPDPAAAGDPTYRVRVAFDVPKNARPQDLCLEQEPPTAEDADRLRVLAVFCVGGAMEAAVIGSLKRPVEATDERFGALLGQMSRQMFERRREL